MSAKKMYRTISFSFTSGGRTSIGSQYSNWLNENQDIEILFVNYSSAQSQSSHIHVHENLIVTYCQLRPIESSHTGDGDTDAVAFAKYCSLNDWQCDEDDNDQWLKPRIEHGTKKGWYTKTTSELYQIFTEQKRK